MTFSFMARLYSMMTGLKFSSIPRESIRPPWVLPVAYSEARNVTPRNVSRCCSISTWRLFSMTADWPCNSVALLPSTRKSLMSLMSPAPPVPRTDPRVVLQRTAHVPPSAASARASASQRTRSLAAEQMHPGIAEEWSQLPDNR